MLVSSSPAWAQQHYTNCLSNNANDATVIIPSDAAVTLGSGDSLSTGDEIALYSNDGRCAGIGVWDSSKTALSIAVADRDNTAGVTEGYETAEELKYRIWRKSDGQEFQVASVAYSCSLPGCKSDGLYERDALFEVETLDASSALPVELASFEATHRGRAVELRWRTVSETNNSGFKVQHKARSQGSWSTLTFVEGAGTTSRPQAYQYEAANLEYGTHQFRLVQIDQDGSRNETKPVGVELKLDRAYEISKVSPNPVRQSGTVNLTVQKTQHVTVRLYDLLGRKQGVLFDRSLSSDQTTQIQVRTDLLPNGRYFLQVDGEDFQTTRRFTVVK
jgi:hypothetical protein